MNRIIATFVISLILVSCSKSSIEQVEQVSASDGEIVIPYTKYRLQNGLTVILHEDNSDPLVHVDVTYHVGSAREEARRSGFAHFFEHMMFQGSKNVADEEHFKIITEAGGTLNGTTNSDRTNYFETVPSNSLETMLWLEADRMGFLLEAVTQQKFEVQRSTVKNERGQNVENRPYGRFNEVNSAALYPAGHPYSWPVIGYPEDLDAATVEDLKHFFLRWYGPNNATLTIGGNINKKEALALVEKYFGSIPRGPEVIDDQQAAASLNSDRYVSYVDKNIRFPALLFTFPTVPYDHPDRVALDCLAQIIGDGRKSYLYKQFVLTQKAIQASSFNDSSELAGSVTFFVLPFPGTSLSQFEGEMRQLLADFNEDSITDDDIQIFKAGREAGLVRALTSVRGKVTQLAFYETFLENPNNIKNELAAVKKLTKEDVARVFNTYIKDKASIVQSVVPENDPEGQAKPDNFTIPDRLERDESATSDLEPRLAVDDFDRSVRPVPGPTPLVPVPDFWQAKLESGVQVIGTETKEVPMVTIQLDFDGGHLLNEASHYGLASLTASMMNEGTSTKTAEEFEIELQKLGSRISVGSGREGTGITMVSLSDRLDETLALLEERLFNSKFTEEDLNRIRQQEIESLEANKKQPSSIAADVYSKLLYGEGHSFSVSSTGTKETLEGITLADIEAFSENSLFTDALQIVVVGDVDQQQALKKLEFINQLPKTGLVAKSQPAVPQRDETVFYFVDKPGAEQSEIRIGYMTDLPYDATGEYFKRYLTNYILGGAFNSRINLNLREDKGYTYGARSGFSGNKMPGPFTASASVKKENTADSVVEFLREITEYREAGITTEELDFVRSAIGQRDALRYETPGQKAGFLGRIIEYGLPKNYVEQQARIINTITEEEVNNLAKQHFPLEKMMILVVGDKTVTFESLRDLGYEIIELDAEGNPV